MYNSSIKPWDKKLFCGIALATVSILSATQTTQASIITPGISSYYTIDANSGTIIGTSGSAEYLNKLKVDTRYSDSSASRYGYGVLANTGNINLYLQPLATDPVVIDVDINHGTGALYVYGLKNSASNLINIQEGTLNILVKAGSGTVATNPSAQTYVYGVNTNGNMGDNAQITTVARGASAASASNNLNDVYNYGIYGLTPNSVVFGDGTTVNLENHGSYLDTAPASGKMAQTQIYAYGITNATLGKNTTVNINNVDDGTTFARASNLTTSITNAYATADARSIGMQASTSGNGLNIVIRNTSGTTEATNLASYNLAKIAQSNVIINTKGLVNSTVGDNANITMINQAGTATAQLANSGNVAKATASVYSYGTNGNVTLGDNATINISSIAGHAITKGSNAQVISHATTDAYSLAEVNNFGIYMENTAIENAKVGKNANIRLFGQGGIANDYTSMPDAATGTSAESYVYGAATFGNTGSRIVFDENSSINVQAIGGIATTNGNNAKATAYAIGAYGNVSFKGSTGIVAAATAGVNNSLLSERHGYAVYIDDSNFKLFINRADSSSGNEYLADAQVRLVGDIVNYGGEIKITAENSSSYIHGTVIQDPSAKTFLALDKGAQWSLAANTYSSEQNSLKPIITLTDAGYTPTIANSIDVYSLTVGNDVLINLTSDNAVRQYNNTLDHSYRTLLSTGNRFNITGNNNTFVLNTDISHNIADKIVIDSSAAGTNYIKVNYDPAVFTNTPVKNFVKTLVVEAKSGVSANNFQAKFTGVTSEYGAYRWTPTVLQDGLNWYITSLNLGPSGKVRTAADASWILNSMLFINNEDLVKRLGELRSATHNSTNPSGVWARYNNGKFKSGSGNKTELGYSQFTVGYDRVQAVKTGKIYRGFAISHTNGSSIYETGSGKNTGTILSLYQAWLSNKGHYYDLVLKTGRLSGDYGIYNLLNEYDKSAFSTWATTISGEYGYSKQLKEKLYLEPQAQVTLGKINGYNYTTSSLLNISANSSSVALLRLGFNLKQTLKAGSIYLRANYFHNFASGSTAVQSEGLRYARDGKLSNWIEIGLGGTWQVGKNCNLYLEADKYFLDIKNNLNIITGTRWSF